MEMEALSKRLILIASSLWIQCTDLSRGPGHSTPGSGTPFLVSMIRQLPFVASMIMMEAHLVVLV